MKDVSAAKFTPDPGSLHGDMLTGCFPIDHTYVADTGRVLRAVMVFVDFPNARAEDLQNRYGSFDYYYDALAAEGLEFFQKASFGKLRLSIDRVDKWFRMPKNDSDYHMSRVMKEEDHRAYIAEAVRLTENEVDYRKYDMLYIVPPKSAVNVPFSPTMCARKVSDIVTSYGARVGLAVTVGQDMHHRRGKLLVHETGHMMGMPDYYTYHPEEGETAFAHCGGWDVMGWIEGRAPDFFGYGKWRFGWFDDDQVEVYPDAGTYEQLLTPVETESGSKLAVIPIDGHSGYVCESRRGISLDAALEDRQGVLIYLVNGYRGSGDGCLSVIPPQRERFRRLDRDDNEELFGTGEGQTDTFTDEVHGITIRVKSSGAEGDVIEITRSRKENAKKHILISGERGAGKSTMIRKLTEMLGRPVYGFCTSSTDADENGFHDIHIHPAALPPEYRIFSEKNRIGNCNRKIHNVRTEIFETLGVKYLSDCGPGGIIVMDELGFMEKDAAAFQNKVIERLQGGIPVLAAIKNRQDIDFLNTLRALPETVEIVLTEENREEVFARLNNIIQSW